MHWTRRVGLLCLCLLPLSAAKFAQGQNQITTSNGGVVYLDDASGSLALSSDGGNYILFHKIVGDGPGFEDGFSRIGVRTRLWEPGEDHIFGEVHALITDSARFGYNAGVGYRAPVMDGLIGVHGWYDDYETGFGNRYRQITGGVEYLSPYLDIRANGYFPIDEDNNLINVTGVDTDPFFVGNNIAVAGQGRVERTLSGWDLEGGGPVPGAMDWLRGYLGIYQLIDDNDETLGFHARAEARFMEGVNLNLIVNDDDRFGTNVNLGVEVRFRGTMPTRFANGLLADRRYDQVRRVWPIRSGVAIEDIDVPLTRPGTDDPLQVVWVNNTNGDPGDGTFENPFMELPGMADGADLILVERGVGDTLGNIVLQDDQQLLGEGQLHFVDTDQLGVIELPDPFDSTGAAPILRGSANTTTPIVTLADRNVVRSFELAGTTGIGGSGVDSFLIDSIESTEIFRGIDIGGASGTGFISNIDFDVMNGGDGILVSNTATPLALDLDDVTIAGGNLGIAVATTDGGDVDMIATDLDVSGTVVAGLQLSGSNATLDSLIENADFSDNGGDGGRIELSSTTGETIFNLASASRNGADGLNVIVENSSDYDLSILDSVLDGNMDDNLDVEVDTNSTLDLFVDPTSLVDAGDNAFEFDVDGASTLNAIFDEVTMTGSTDNAVLGSIREGSSAALDFTNFDASGSGADGLNLSVVNNSTLTGFFTDGSFSDSDSSAVDVSATGTSVSNLSFTNVTADNMADDGNVNLTSGSQSRMNTGWVGGSISNGNATGVTLTAAGAGTQNGLMTDGVNIDGNALDGINATMTLGGADSMLDLALANTTLQGNGEDGLDYQISGNGATGVISFDGVQATGNGQDGFQFDATFGADLMATTVADSMNSFSDNLSNAFQGTATGSGSTAMVQISGAMGLNSGEEGALLNATSGGDLVFDYSNGSLSNSGEDGLQVNVDGLSSSALILLTDVELSDNGQVNLNSGDGLSATASDRGNIDLGLVNVTAESNAETGFEFIASDSSFIDVLSSGLTIDDNAEEGIRFESTDGAGFTLNVEGASISDNGTAGSFSGVAGLVDGAGTMASISLSDAQVQGNSNDGLAFDVTDDAVFIGEILSTGTGTTDISGNNGNGISLTATGSNTVAALVMDGETTVGTNNGSGLNVNANGIDQLAIQASGMFNGNGGNGIRIDAMDIDTAAIDLGTGTQSSAMSNIGDGISISLTDIDEFAPIDVTTLTRTVTVDGFSLGDVESGSNLGDGIVISGSGLTFDTLELANISTSNNMGHGVVLDLVDTTINTLSIDSVTSTLNLFDGIHVDLTDSQVGMFNMVDSVASSNMGNGARFDLDNTPITEMNILRNNFGIAAGMMTDPSMPIDDSLPVIRNGFNLNTLPANDDGSTGLEPLGFDANFFGQVFNAAFVNNNGNITFDQPLGTFTPFGLLGTSSQIIAPFFADVDTGLGNEVTYSQGMVNGRQAFGVNWIDVRHFSVTGANQGLPTNSFQLVLIDRSDVRPGDFDIEFNYGQILWEAGEASGSDAFGLGGSSARVGFSNGVDTSFELPGSGINGAFLDSGPAATSLVNNSIDSVHNGRYIFFARDGDVGGDPGADVGNTGDGLQVNALNGSDIGTLNIEENAVELNGARGISINAEDSDIGGGSITLNTVDQNLSHGIALDFDNSRLDDMTFEMNTITTNSQDGILLDFNGSPVTNLAIINHPDINENGGNGINFQMVDSNIDGLLIDNNGMGSMMPPNPGSNFDIVINLLGGLTPSQQAVFQQAEMRWEEIIIGDVPDIAGIDDLVIDAQGVPIDGPGGILGQAGPRGLRPGSFIPFQGIMQFDTADLANLEASGQLADVILHEMGHVLGIGTIWDNLGFLVGAGSADPRFNGPLATAEYNIRFNNMDPDIPVANTGGPGTRDSHWRESVFQNELMTGFLNAGVPNPISIMTIQSMADLGYVVDNTVADPFIVASPLATQPTMDPSQMDIGDIVERPTENVADMNDLAALREISPALEMGDQQLLGLANLRMNGENGINVSLTNSDLTGAVVSRNIITNHENGDAFRMLNPTSAGNPIEIDFDANMFMNNSGKGINVTLAGTETIRTNMTDNEISMNGEEGIGLALTENATIEVNDFSRNILDANATVGVRIDATNDSSVTFNAGASSDETDLNVITDNGDAGIGIMLTENAVGNIRITNTNVSGTTFTPGNDFFGGGLELFLDDDASVTDLTIGHETLSNTTFSGNAGDGIVVATQLSSSLIDPVIQNVGATLNGADGLIFFRQGTATIDNVVIRDSGFSMNSGDGIDITASQGDLTDEFLITGNTIASNTLNGLRMEALFDGDIVATISENQIGNNGNNGVLFTEFSSSPLDSPTISADFLNNDISFNSGTGVLVQTAEQLSFDGNTVDNNGFSGIDIQSSASLAGPVSITNGSISNNGSDGLIVGNIGADVEVINVDAIGNGFDGLDFNNVGNDVLVQDSTISDNTLMGIELDNVGGNAQILNNTIDGNLDGILAFDVSTTITDNVISNSGNRGIRLVGGTHSLTNNMVEMNLGDGLVLISEEGRDLTVTADNNTFREGFFRGVNMLVRGDTTASVSITNSTIEGNAFEGVYLVTTADSSQSENALATSALASNGDPMANTILEFVFDNNVVMDNGVFSGFDGTGLVMRVGTSGAGTDFADDGGFVTDGAGNLTGRGGVFATVTNSSFIGHPAADVLIESFDSTANPATTAGTWDAANFEVTNFVQDPLARLDLIFTGNTGQDLDVVRAGASYNNNEAVFKSRTMAQTPAGPFASGTRARNAQRLASRTGFADPANVNGVSGDSDNFLYSGVGESTFRISAGSSDAGFTGGDSFGDTINLGAGIGELPFGWGSF